MKKSDGTGSGGGGKGRGGMAPMPTVLSSGAFLF